MNLSLSSTEVEGIVLRYVRNNMKLDEHFNTAKIQPDGSIALTWVAPAAGEPQPKRAFAWMDRNRKPATEAPILMTEGATA